MITPPKKKGVGEVRWVGWLCFPIPTGAQLPVPGAEAALMDKHQACKNVNTG